MAENTKIEWADMTFNPWIGCTRVSPGCDHCYAEAHAARFGTAEWGPGKPRHRTSAANWRKPLAWNAQHWVECMSCGWRGEARKGRLVENPPGFHPPAPSARACPGCGQFTLLQTRARVFCSSLADVFDNEVPDGWRQDLFELIGETPNLDWLLLTKRIGNVPKMLEQPGMPKDGLPPNVWLGITVVNQAEADRDIPKLLAVSAAKRFLSMEPLLGPVDVTPFLWGKHETVDDVCQNCPRDADCECGYHTRTALKLPALHWVIVGGESGPNARPMHPEWARSLRDQCVSAGVPFFFKQWGEWVELNAGPPPHDVVSMDDEAGQVMATACDGFISLTGDFVRDMASAATDEPYRGLERVGKKAAGRLLDGRTWDEVPK